MTKWRETSWGVARYAFALGVAALVCAVASALLVLAVGLPLVALGLAATLLLPFGADPPLLGFAFGIALMLSSVVATLAALLGVVVLSVAWSALVLTPIALLARVLASRLKSGSLSLELALLLLGGELAGLAVAVAVWLAWEWSALDSGPSFWALAAACALGSIAGIASAGAYALALLGMEGVRAGWGVLARRWARK